MENQHEHQQQHLFLRKMSSLFSFPSSCQFRALSDIAETKTTTHRIDDLVSNRSSSYQCPKLVTTVPENPKRNLNNESKRSVSQHMSSSAHSGLFSSTETTDTFFTNSTNSGDSFRLKTIRDETGHVPCRGVKKCSSVFPVCEEGESDQISAQVYYSKPRCRKTGKKPRRKKKEKKAAGFGLIEESGFAAYAVEKSSSDVRGDFRDSMVEMIIQKQMFGAHDLDKLLHCFLSLNSLSYHALILDVFQEICQTLFTH